MAVRLSKMDNGALNDAQSDAEPQLLNTPDSQISMDLSAPHEATQRQIEAQVTQCLAGSTIQPTPRSLQQGVPKGMSQLDQNQQSQKHNSPQQQGPPQTQIIFRSDQYIQLCKRSKICGGGA